jgi:hypothetical protein
MPEELEARLEVEHVTKTPQLTSAQFFMFKIPPSDAGNMFTLRFTILPSNGGLIPVKKFVLAGGKN